MTAATIRISRPRLLARIAALARFGALPGGGVTRPCWSPSHEAARAWLLDEMRGAGLAAWVDPAGNVFGALGVEAILPDAPVVLTGSHIDTVPEGGILDGALGVLAGLEALQAIREGDGAHRRPLAVAAWSDEEGRYGSLFGSRAFCGRLDLTRVEAMAAVDGERLVDAMARAGFDARRVAEAQAPAGAVAAYVELHIEQGPRLEEAGIPIGVVDSIVGVRRTRVAFVGQADHAGTTPMERRRDGFLGAAEYALKARDLVVKHGGGKSVTNIGVVRVHPGVTNIVPARGELVHEMRGPDAETLARLDRRAVALARSVARPLRSGRRSGSFKLRESMDKRPGLRARGARGARPDARRVRVGHADDHRDPALRLRPRHPPPLRDRHVGRGRDRPRRRGRPRPGPGALPREARRAAARPDARP